MKHLLNKKWGELEGAIREELLIKAAAVDGVTGDAKTSPGF